MEMQQNELFASRPGIAHVIPHLRLVQTSERLDVFQGRAANAKCHELAAPVVSLSIKPQKALRASQEGLRAIAPEHVEGFLNQLHGEALLVGALSYDLGLRLSQLRFLRIRDVNLMARVIELSDGAKQIPAAIFDDLKDHISEKMCGVESGRGVQKRDQLLFSHQAFAQVLLTCASFFAPPQREVSNADGASDLTISALHSNQGTELGQRVSDNFLRVVGWFHTKRAVRRGGRIESPLGLFDKGPKIVRRDRGGAIHSYYLWRAVYSR